MHISTFPNVRTIQHVSYTRLGCVKHKKKHVILSQNNENSYYHVVVTEHRAGGHYTAMKVLRAIARDVTSHALLLASSTLNYKAVRGVFKYIIPKFASRD